MSEPILIAGAGIGGLVAALSLHDAGFGVRVFEAVTRIEALGVGINLLPHAVRELEAIGLGERLEAEGVACRELVYFTKRGERIWFEPRGREAGYRWPQISIHRGRLQEILLEAVIERLGTDAVRTGARVAGFENVEGGVRVGVESAEPTASGEPVSIEGPILIAADGLHSSVRRQMHPREGAPRWNGAMLWRGVALARPFLDGRTMIMAGHPDLKFVAYPIRPPDPITGLQSINFIAERRGAPDEDFESADWNRRASIEDFLPRYSEWCFDWLDVPGLIEAATAVWVYPMSDRDPLTRWTDGRATLLGDAAHPMYPIGSNGASQAILDARALTGCLRAWPDEPEAALRAYEDARRPATTKIVEANRGMGPELPMQLVEERAPDGFDRLEDVISREELEAIASRYKQVAGFTIDELNQRPSLAEPSLWRS